MSWRNIIFLSQPVFQSMQWRAQIGADTLLTEWDPPEVLKRYYAGGPGGYGKEGHLIWFDLASHMDFKGEN